MRNKYKNVDYSMVCIEYRNIFRLPKISHFMTVNLVLLGLFIMNSVLHNVVL